MALPPPEKKIGPPRKVTQLTFSSGFLHLPSIKVRKVHFQHARAYFNAMQQPRNYMIKYIKLDPFVHMHWYIVTYRLILYTGNCCPQGILQLQRKNHKGV